MVAAARCLLLAFASPQRNPTAQAGEEHSSRQIGAREAREGRTGCGGLARAVFVQCDSQTVVQARPAASVALPSGRTTPATPCVGGQQALCQPGVPCNRVTASTLLTLCSKAACLHALGHPRRTRGSANHASASPIEDVGYALDPLCCHLLKGRLSSRPRPVGAAPRRARHMSSSGPIQTRRKVRRTKKTPRSRGEDARGASTFSCSLAPRGRRRRRPVRALARPARRQPSPPSSLPRSASRGAWRPR